MEGVPETIIQTAEARMGGIDLLVNNAGTSWVAETAQIPADRVDQILNVNVRAVVRMCQAAIPALEKSGIGQIINVSSIADRLPMATLSTYCASKAAVTMFTGSSPRNWLRKRSGSTPCVRAGRTRRF